MKYLCLVYLDEKKLAELPDEDCVDFDASIRESGHCIASEALQSVQTATRLPCIAGYPAGWSFLDKDVRRDSSTYWLTSAVVGAGSRAIVSASRWRFGRSSKPKTV